MSLANIRRLLQEDTVLRLPAIVAYATARKQVVSITAFQTCTLEDGSQHITQICMLHINTQGKIQWTHDTVAPTVALPAGWLRQNQIDEQHLAKSQTWRQGWNTAMQHMAKNNAIVVAQHEDIGILQQQFVHASNLAPAFPNVLSLRNMFHERHPSKSMTMKDMAAYYQVYLDPEKHLKAVIVTYAKLLEKMLSEQAVTSPEEAPLDLAAESSTNVPQTPEDAKKWVTRAEAGANTALDFFAKIAQQFPFRLVHNNHGKIQGYSVLIQQEWVKGTQLGSHLGWPQISQDHHWKVDDDEMRAIDALQHSPGA